MLLCYVVADFHYTDKMMSFAYDRFLPDGMKWRDMFDMVRSPCSNPSPSHVVLLYEPA